MRHFIKLIFWVLLSLPTTVLAQHVKIMVVAIHGVEIAQREWQPTIDFLQQTLPRHTFSLIPLAPIDLDNIKTLINRQEIDFVITQPAIYVELEKNYGISRILTMVKEGGFSQFGSVIITRADSDIKSVDGLRGKIIAGVARLGYGGWLIGYKELLDQGFDAYEDAKEVIFLGTQPREIEAVYEGKADAAVIRTGLLEKLAKEEMINISDFKILAPKKHPGFPFYVSTPLYPEWAFAKTQKVSNELSKEVALALLSLQRNNLVAQKARLQQWTFPYDYQPVHELMKTLNVGPYKDYGKISTMNFFKQHKTEAILLLILTLIILFMMIIVHRSNINLFKEKAEKEKALEKMKYLATHDSLTGLPNRFLFMELLEKMVYDAKRRKTAIAVMFIDLDGFKKINDDFGHNFGDKILCQVASTLIDSLRLNDIAGRLGGDEFIVAINEVKEIEDLQSLTKRIIKHIASIELPTTANFTLGASIGVIFGQMDQNNSESLIQLSDKLMYAAKQAGKGQAILQDIATYTPGTTNQTPAITL